MITWIISPLNEGQEMNYYLRFQGSKRLALKKAEEIQRGLERLLPGADITCLVQHAYKGRSCIADEKGPCHIVSGEKLGRSER